MNTLLAAKAVTKTYISRGQRYEALRGVDLCVGKGEFVGIMGPSGSGKTTLLNLLATIDLPSSGSISIGGKDLATFTRSGMNEFRRDRLGFIFQDFNLLDTLSVEENVALPLALAGKPAALIRERSRLALARLGMTEFAAKRPWELSGGQRQRTAAARAIVGSPELLFADEPTGNLDSRSSRELLGFLGGINERDGTTILMVTHDAFAASFCTRILLLKDGTIAGQVVRGESRQVFFDRIIDALRALEGGLS